MKILENEQHKLIVDNENNEHEADYTLFSYNTKIANYKKNYNCKGILYLTKDYKYSRTTSKHLNAFIRGYCKENFNLKNLQSTQNLVNNFDADFIYYVEG